MKKKIKLIEIGIGPHAMRIYCPILKKLSDENNIELCLAIDLKEKESIVRDYFISINLSPQLLFIDSFKENVLPQSLADYLNKYVIHQNIDGVIISTEPLCHKAYAKWALNCGLHILMDKPITTSEDVVSNLSHARNIEEDYLELLQDYFRLQTTKETIFSINAQRRFHPGFQLVCNLIQEVAEKTNCPVTSINSMHCDGQWRFPSEIVTQDYHPYNCGYGKASHSGYHIFDTVYQFYKSSQIPEKKADLIEIFSSFVQPRGFLMQLTEQDYHVLFGDDYWQVKNFSDNELWEIFQNYGEIDVAAVIKLLKNQENVGNITINLLHNSFARRDWMYPGKDLYKGNGRVKHEYHNIQQGPFQNIQIHSYQSKDKHDINNYFDNYLGGNNHFEIYIFNNTSFLNNEKSLQVITINDIKQMISASSDDRLFIEAIKYRVVLEFIDFIKGKLHKEDLTSNIDDHLMPVRIMSGIYQSHILYTRGHNPLVKYDLSFNLEGATK